MSQIQRHITSKPSGKLFVMKIMTLYLPLLTLYALLTLSRGRILHIKFDNKSRFSYYMKKHDF